MPKRTSGFTLIELMIYLTLSAFIMLLLNNFAPSFYLKLARIMKSNMANSQLWAAQDMFMRDLHGAPGRRQDWKKIGSDCLIWDTHQTEHIGWCVEDKKLYRITGIYDPITQRWSKKMRSLAATNISEFSCSLHTTGSSIIGANICLTSKQADISQELNFYVALHNRDIDA